MRPPSECPNWDSANRPASIHSLTIVETVALFKPVRRPISARLMGEWASTWRIISQRLATRMSFVCVIFMAARSFLR